MSLFSIVPCNEVHGTREENLSILDAPECKVTLQCDYLARYDLVTDLLLFQRTWPYFISPYIPRAVSCSITNIPTKYIQDQQCVVYEQSLVAVTYSSKYPDLFSEELEITNEFQDLDPNDFTWVDGTPLSQGMTPGFLRRGIIISKTFYDVLDPLSPLFIKYASPKGQNGGGAVNSDYVTNSMGFVFEPETLLYTPPRLSRTVRFDSTNAWQVNCKLVHNPTGWNNFWNQTKIQYMNIKTKANKFGANTPAQIYKPYPPMPFTGFLF